MVLIYLFSNIVAKSYFQSSRNIQMRLFWGENSSYIFNLKILIVNCGLNVLLILVIILYFQTTRSTT